MGGIPLHQVHKTRCGDEFLSRQGQVSILVSWFQIVPPESEMCIIGLFGQEVETTEDPGRACSREGQERKPETCKERRVKEKGSEIRI